MKMSVTRIIAKPTWEIPEETSLAPKVLPRQRGIVLVILYEYLIQGLCLVDSA